MTAIPTGSHSSSNSRCRQVIRATSLSVDPMRIIEVASRIGFRAVALTVRTSVALALLVGLAAAQVDCAPQLTESKLFEIVHKLESTAHASKEQIESITGRKTVSRVVVTRISDTSDADIITKFESNMTGTGETTGVILFVNRGLKISPDEIRKNFGQKPAVRQNPKVGIKDVSTEYEYTQKHGWTNFWFVGTGKQALVRYVNVTYQAGADR
ncbi:MAG: hypothetical protein ACRD3W_22380 [Terriglobales bacterium]